jgi:hypothetical protein
MINFLFGLTVGILAAAITAIVAGTMAIKKLKKDSDESVKNKPYVMYMKYYTHEI